MTKPHRGRVPEQHPLCSTAGHQCSIGTYRDPSQRIPMPTAVFAEHGDQFGRLPGEPLDCGDTRAFETIEGACRSRTRFPVWLGVEPCGDHLTAAAFDSEA